MTRTGKTQEPAGSSAQTPLAQARPARGASTAGPARGRRLLLRAAAWTLAVPALCVAVLVGGAAPLYLLLPDAKPSGAARLAAAPPPAPAPGSVGAAASAPSTAAEAAPAIEPVEDELAPATSVDAMPDEGAEPIEAAAVTAVPTPKPPAGPKPYTPPSASPVEGDRPREIAAPAQKKPAQTVEAEAGRPMAPIDGRRGMVRVAAKLRAAPQGAEIGVLPEGAEIVVGRCTDWCEVSVGDRRGFVHASLIDGTRQSARREAARRDEQRRPPDRFFDERDARRDPDERPRDERRRAFAPEDEVYRDARRRDDAAREDERWFEERAYRRGEEPDWLREDRSYAAEEPGWFVEEEPPVLFYDEPYR